MTKEGLELGQSPGMKGGRVLSHLEAERNYGQGNGSIFSLHCGFTPVLGTGGTRRRSWCSCPKRIHKRVKETTDFYMNNIAQRGCMNWLGDGGGFSEEG